MTPLTPEEIANKIGQPCPHCDNIGATSEHDAFCDGSCTLCPVQVQCEFCWQNPHSVFNVREILKDYAAQQSQQAWEQGCEETIRCIIDQYFLPDAVERSLKEFTIPPYPGTPALEAEKKEAIAFAEWVQHEAWQKHPDEENIWYLPSYDINIPDETTTSEELYRKFKNTQQ